MKSAEEKFLGALKQLSSQDASAMIPLSALYKKIGLKGPEARDLAAFLETQGEIEVTKKNHATYVSLPGEMKNRDPELRAIPPKSKLSRCAHCFTIKPIMGISARSQNLCEACSKKIASRGVVTVFDLEGNLFEAQELCS